MLTRLLYHSRNNLDPAAGTLLDQVTTILGTAVANNNRINVTGALVYDANWFAQVLEGEKADVLSVYNKIKLDPRHNDVAVIESKDVDERLFPFWWMTSIAWTDAKAGMIRRFGIDDTFDPRVIPADTLIALMQAMVHVETYRPIVATIGAAARR